MRQIERLSCLQETMEFIEIVGFPNYAVNILGDVKNVTSGKILKPCIRNGYLLVCLCTHNKRTEHKIHRLIALHFIPNPENKPCVDHINRIRTDNRIENLRWATYCENNQNKSIHKNNKLKEQNISIKMKKYFMFQKRINGATHRKSFNTLDEAIEYRDNYISIV